MSIAETRPLYSRIFKYQLTHESMHFMPQEVSVPIPMGAKLLSVQNQMEIITLWAEVNPIL